MLYSIRTTLFILVQVVEYSILARCIVSWLPIGRENKFISFLYQITEPFLAPIRALLSKTRLGSGGFMLDLSPIIAFLVLEVIVTPIIGLIH